MQRRQSGAEDGVPEPSVGSGADALNFHRRVLDALPSPVVVVDEVGRVNYTNAAMSLMSGYRPDELLGVSIIDYLHPEDAAWVVEAFFQLVGGEGGPSSGSGAWGSIRCRLITADGTIVPTEVTGTDRLRDDPNVGGVVYDVRPAHLEQLLREVLHGLASGEPIDALLSRVVQIMTIPPFDFDAVILDCGLRLVHHVVAASDDRLPALFAQAGDPAPWSKPSVVAVRATVDEIPGPVGMRLAEAGYVDCWHAAIVGAHPSTAYRLVGCTPTQHRPANSVLQRFEQAQELAAVVLARSHTDRLLEHPARHDRLTGLPNRLAFYQELEHLEDENRAVGVLYLDLDDFKPVNDRFGHATGDAVLIEIGRRLRDATRPSDFVARIGGDEFVVLVSNPGVLDPTDHIDEFVASAVGDRILVAIAQPIDLDNAEVEVAASVGILLARAGAGADRLVAAADAAMYEAKSAGGNRGVVRSLADWDPTGTD